MVRKFLKPFYYLSALVTCLVLSMTTGCASGGFKLTRGYAGFVNGQNIIIRIVLYILTGVVFAVTILVDLVVFNTVDFWEGKVSAGTYEFKGGEKTYQVRHEFIPGSKLRRSTIRISGLNHKLLQEIVLSETPTGEIEALIDGKKRVRVQDISTIPVATIFDKNERQIDEKTLWFTDAKSLQSANLAKASPLLIYGP